MHQETTNRWHEPVLLESVLHYLNPGHGESYLDLTAGYGGHAGEILKRTKAPTKAVLVDRDEKAVTVLKQKFTQGEDIRTGDYLSISQLLAESGKQFDLILADLGVSSPHLNEGSRGFSFANSGPLDMRMDQTQLLSAHIVVNEWTQTEISRILKQFGEEPKAEKISRLIVGHRPIKTTEQLAEVIKKAWPGHSRSHPATRSFQAIRVAVNDELGQLEASLPIWKDLLRPNGRLGLISFHSLEDRLIKQFFKEFAGQTYDAELQVLTKRPVTASPNELVFNPRSRSAKLRVAVNIKK